MNHEAQSSGEKFNQYMQNFHSGDQQFRFFFVYILFSLSTQIKLGTERQVWEIECRSTHIVAVDTCSVRDRSRVLPFGWNLDPVTPVRPSPAQGNFLVCLEGDSSPAAECRTNSPVQTAVVRSQQYSTDRPNKTLLNWPKPTRVCTEAHFPCLKSVRTEGSVRSDFICFFRPQVRGDS